jgi:hypothetical protein
MSEPGREAASYFSFPRRREQSASSSPTISPHTSMGRSSPASPPKSKIPRPILPRTVSEYPVPQPRVEVQTIEEDSLTGRISQVSRRATKASRHRRWSSQTRCSDSSPTKPTKPSRDHRWSSETRPSASSSKRSAAAASPRFSQNPQMLKGNSLDILSTRQESVTEPPSKSRPGHRWARTRSGGVWYQRLKGSSGQSSSASQNASIPKHFITPLTPPTPPAMARGPPYYHTVKVEKSFTNHKPARPDATPLQPSQPVHSSQEAASSTGRRRSVDPLRLFSAPLYLVRRFGTSRGRLKRNHAATEPGSTTSRDFEMAGHRSLLRRNHTAEALRQVTSILHHTALQEDARSPTTVVMPPNLRQLTDKSTSSKGSKYKGPRRKVKRGPVSPPSALSRSDTQDLLQIPQSYTSSQLELKMGGQPANTPDERATYKIKRSASADTEEFLKVDISVRGATSYLPSEARRIHTPPLPQEGLDGKRRGFFFDYTAPEIEDSRKGSTAGPLMHVRQNLPANAGAIPRRSTSKATTVYKKTLHARKGSKGRGLPRSKTCGDWYDAKLAELETSGDEDDEDGVFQVAVANHTGPGRMRSTTTKSDKSLSEIKKKKQQEQFDYNILEHLPNSPLCPRHPKYWRVVQGKGSQFRGCWMHGVGLYGDREGTIAGTARALGVFEALT